MTDLPDACDATAIEEADARVVTLAATVRDNPAVRFAGLLAEGADQPPLIAASAAMLAGGLALGRPRLARTGGRMLAAHLLATWIKGVIKDRIDRTRPHVLLDEDEYHMAPGTSREGRDRSFPSGHTAGIVAVTRAIAREYSGARLPGAIVAAGVAGIQMPRARHYPSDLAAGAAIGWAAEAAVDAAMRVAGIEADGRRNAPAEG